MAHPSPDDSRGHWSRLCQGFQVAPSDFYAQVEAAVDKRSLPGVVVERIEYSQGGALSDKRLYLRVRRRRVVFDVCGAPFGDGFFFSWWLAELPPAQPAFVTIFVVLAYFGLIGWLVRYVGALEGPAMVLVLLPLVLFLVSRMGNEDADDLMMSLPLIGPVYRKLFNPLTYYRYDTADMFRQAVEKVVQEVIRQMTAAKGIRALTELERKPVMREFGARV